MNIIVVDINFFHFAAPPESRVGVLIKKKH